MLFEELWMLFRGLFKSLVYIALFWVVSVNAGETTVLKEDIDAMVEEGMAAYHINDLSKAMPLLGRAAEMGHAKAQGYLAYQLHKASEYDLALKWYEKSAKQGYSESQYGLAGMYREGKGVDVNYEQALNWYQQAAEGEFVAAQSALATAYERGHLDLPVDFERAFSWYTKAALGGQLQAAKRLVMAYRLGELGRAIDLKQAQRWQQQVEKILAERERRATQATTGSDQ